jgi:hypothetical protein
MSDTPRTDAAQGYIGTDAEFYKDTTWGYYVEVEFARTLERQNAELLAALKRIATGEFRNIGSAKIVASEAIRRAEGWN